MKIPPLPGLLLLASIQAVLSAGPGDWTPDCTKAAFAGREGVFYIVDCRTGEEFDSNSEASSTRLPPCSTFKIWNALFGFELGLLTDPNEPFYQWDGVPRSIAAWNKNLNLRKAFQASCVPAFQDLARRIGRDRMSAWIEKTGYGDRNISSGLDVFWLPEKGRNAILISPREQTNLLCRLLTGRLPVSPHSLAMLKQLMEVKKTDTATLYGKTGSSGFAGIGWFVGFVESPHTTHAFACVLHNAAGSDARAAVEKILHSQNLL